MFRFIFYILIVVIFGSYFLPADIVAKVPYGPQTQRFTKETISWAIDAINERTGGAISNTVDSVLDDVKEGAKDKLKEVVDDKIDEL